MADALLQAVRQGVKVYDLARPMVAGMPQSPNHPEFRHVLPRRHGDSVRADGGSAASDMFILGGHVGTHIDALAHVSQDGVLHGGADALAAQAGGRFSSHGIDAIASGVCRGVLLDIPRTLGVTVCDPAYEVSVGDLQNALDGAGLHLAPGDAVLIRTGWGQNWDDPTRYLGHATGVPGVGEAGARWLASHSPRLVGGDTIAFERLAAGAGHALLPAHRVLLVEAGINIVETMALEDLAAAGVREFVFVVAPLNLVGATGSPLRPLALTSSA